MKHLYGNFTSNQIVKTKEALHRNVHWLLVYKSPSTEQQFKNIDVDNCFNSLLLRLSGLNELLGCQPVIVSILSVLQAARKENNKDDFDFKVYKKLIFDAHSLIDKIKEADYE